MWRPGALPWPFGPGAAEGVGSHPAAGVAIDAGLVHVEVTLLGRDPRDPRDSRDPGQEETPEPMDIGHHVVVWLRLNIDIVEWKIEDVQHPMFFFVLICFDNVS